MPIRELPKLGTPNLFLPSKPVTEFATPELYALIQDMRDTMVAADGVGIAAPQIGVNKQVFMLGFEVNKRYPNMQSVPFMVLINPKLEVLDQTQIYMWERCLSIPGLSGKVPRYKKVRYRGFDAEGNQIEGIAEGFHARILQHENDHLQGRLYHFHISDMRYFGFEETVMERAVAENHAVIEGKNA